MKETRDSLNKNKENFFDVLKEMNGFMEKTKLLFFEKKDKLIEKLIDKNSSNKNPSNFFNNEDLTKLIACFSKIPKSKQLTKNRKLEIHSFESKNEEDDYKKMNNFKETKNTAKFFSNYINPSNNLKYFKKNKNIFMFLKGILSKN